MLDYLYAENLSLDSNMLYSDDVVICLGLCANTTVYSIYI